MTVVSAVQTIAQARRTLAQALTQVGIDSADADARLLIAHALGLDRAALIANSGRTLSVEQCNAISALAARRLKREPVSRIFGIKEFWSLTLQVNSAVLVPRPETETVVETALDFIDRNDLRMAQLRILDIGTGSGALLLALLSELPNAVGTATDISESALAIARINAERHGLISRCEFLADDIAGGVSGSFDLIVSNPPYIAHDEIAELAPEVRNHDPALALDGGIEGLDVYRAIAGQTRRLLAPGGRLIVELGAGQEQSVRALFTKAGLFPRYARSDLAGIPRALCIAITP